MTTLPSPQVPPVPAARSRGAPRAIRDLVRGPHDTGRATQRTGRPRAAAVAAIVVGGAVMALVGGCQTPGVTTTDVTLGQTVLEMTDAVNALRDQTGVMQAQIDSLRGVVAHQDSTIARLAAAAGVSP